ncbi:hypothetical protein Pelo_18885 [Pelomyxa schiedti]|nr:hypothetical protein Pelo_18885 [Pelomyxa schiedti]
MIKIKKHSHRLELVEAAAPKPDGDAQCDTCSRVVAGEQHYRCTKCTTARHIGCCSKSDSNSDDGKPSTTHAEITQHATGGNSSVECLHYHSADDEARTLPLTVKTYPNAEKFLFSSLLFSSSKATPILLRQNAEVFQLSSSGAGLSDHGAGEIQDRSKGLCH